MQGRHKYQFITSYILSAVSILFGINVFGQPIPPAQPEQDACGALTLCNGYFFTPFSYTGVGKLNGEFYGVNNTPAGFEQNSVWFRVKVAAPGNIVFTISPADSADDYDFSVFNTTNIRCPYDVQALTDARIRYNLNCNSNCGDSAGMLSSLGGNIGLDLVTTDTFTPAGTFGKAFIKYIEARAGDEYLVMVDNFSKSASGFSIDFAGTTALFENTGLQYTSVVAECATHYSTLKVRLSEPVLCSSVAADGSDFTLSPGNPAITGAVGSNCSASQAGSYTWELTLALSNPLPVGGNFVLSSKKGSDGNYLVELCGAGQEEGYTKSFKVALPLTLNAGNDTAVCAGGSIALNARLEGMGDARIRWQPATFLSSNTITNPVVTPETDMEYVVLLAPIGYPAACQSRDTIRVNVLTGFDIVTPDTVLCRSAPVPVQLQGDAEFTYKWSPTAHLSGTSGMFQTATPQQTTAYTITASYPGCKDSLRSVNIVVRQWPALLSKDTFICKGQSLQLKVADAGAAGYRLSWSPSLFLSDALAVEPVTIPDTTTRYKLTASYAGCPDSSLSVEIAVEPAPKIEPLQATPVCLGATAQMNPVISPGWYVGYRYQWAPAASFSNATVAKAVYTALAGTEVSLRVITEHGCAGTTAQYFPVSLPPVVNAGPDVLIPLGTKAVLQGSAGSDAVVVRWSPGSYFSDNTILNPLVAPLANQRYVLTAYNKDGCKSYDSMTVTVLKQIYIPSAFTPNGDGLNDVWNIPGLAAYPQLTVQVYNRWGQSVFESRDYTQPWDGSMKGRQSPPGAYYYIITISANGHTTKMTGSVIVLR